MNLTVQQVISDELVAGFYPLYVAAFDPMRTRAAARHMLTVDEFADELADERIDKYVVWDDRGTPVALMTLATDLTAVAWISPEYYAARYPEHMSRGAVYYLGYTLVHPAYANQGVFTLLSNRLEERLTERRAVCAFDVCAYNDARSIGRRVAALVGSGANVETLDVQTYYAADFAAIAAHDAGPALGGSAPAVSDDAVPVAAGVAG